MSFHGWLLLFTQCVKNVAYVRVGEYNLSTELDCIGDETVGIDCLNNTQDFEVGETKVHENFTMSADFIINDIALIRLKKKVDFSFDNIGPICLPIPEQDITKNRGKIVVWGLNKPNYTVMRKYDIWLTPLEECYKKCNSPSSLKDIKLMSEYCVRKEDIYNADIGGPLMFRTFGNNRLAQHGVASRETAECVFYTNVADYIYWILENIRE
ncbi:phenoloxidase-activating factor 3-like [Aricia agestis]|uniref:phenoloxidase-activating factor 3-like n=1 Tax=Aricia agestis TaxID=91739 RepID=UPI001C2068DB|nr:phenoloxidase-activating factor 3-like [Aricia agestis]